MIKIMDNETLTHYKEVIEELKKQRDFQKSMVKQFEKCNNANSAEEAIGLADTWFEKEANEAEQQQIEQTKRYMYYSDIIGKIYNDCRIDDMIDFFKNTKDIPTSDSCEQDGMLFVAHVKDSVYMVKNILNVGVNNYRSIITNLGMGNHLNDSVSSLERCYEIAKSATQSLLAKDVNHDTTHDLAMHAWVTKKSGYANISVAIKFLNDFFVKYKEKASETGFNTTTWADYIKKTEELDNLFTTYYDKLVEISQQTWTWFNGKDSPQTKKLEEKIKNFKKTDSFIMDLYHLNNDFEGSNVCLYNPLYAQLDELLNKHGVSGYDLYLIGRILNFENETWDGGSKELLETIKQNENVKQKTFLLKLWEDKFKNDK